MLTDLQKLLLAKVEQGRQKTLDIIDSNTVGTGFKRPIYHELAKSIEGFLADKTAHSQWTIITGLRGVGKTTLLAQLYQHPSLENCAKFYLSLDEIHAAGATIDDISTVIESCIKARIARTESPVFVFLDEVHFLPQWSLTTKVLFDNSRNLFLICTGSSAISFWSNPDIGRRAKMISLPPLSFQEFLGIEGVYREVALKSYTQEYDEKPKAPSLSMGVSTKIKQALFDATSVRETYDQIKPLESEIERQKVPSDSLDNYINFYGSLPYATVIKQQKGYYQDEIDFDVWSATSPLDEKPSRPDKQPSNAEIRDRVIQTLNTLFLRDLEALGRFDSKTKSKFLRLLLMLANASDINLRKISKNLGLNVLTVQNMLKALSDAEIITPIAPAGASLGKISKPYKYLFSSPGLRLALSNSQPSLPEKSGGAGNDRLRGQLLEDTVAMYLKRLFIRQPTTGLVEYDARAGGADFIVMPQGLKSGAIIIEVGYGKTTAKQVASTLKHFKGRYGLVITNQSLALDEKNSAVFVPLKTFLML